MLDVGYYAFGSTSGLGMTRSFSPQAMHETLALNVGFHW